MAKLIVALPILPDRVEAWRRLCQEMMGRRRDQYEASRIRLGIDGEDARLVQMSNGALAVFSMETPAPDHVLSGLLRSAHPFDLWFKRQLLDVHGLDLIEPTSRFHAELMFEWQASDKET